MLCVRGSKRRHSSSSSVDWPVWKLLAHFVHLCSGESSGENLLECSETAYDVLGKLNHELDLFFFPCGFKMNRHCNNLMSTTC